ncbi:MAG: rhomboid family intramembrane serine protease [Bacteroidota bacterium]
MKGIQLVTLLIIAANVFVSFRGFRDFSFFHKYKFNIAEIQRGNRFVIFSSGFLHIDQLHLFVNMLTLFFFANSVIQYLGSFQFIIVYFISLILGNFISYQFHKNEPHYSAVGASGAVVGVLYSAILLQPDMMLGLFFIIPIPAYIFGIGYLFYSIYAMKQRSDNIGHDAHFGGAVGGYIATLVLAPWVISESLLMVILLAIPIIILFVLQKMNKI